MTVAELIEFLKTQPQDLRVAHGMYSEAALLTTAGIHVEEWCVARPDGWIHWIRNDKPSESYLMFPGN